MTDTPLWMVSTRKIRRAIRAVDQWEAWDTLRAEDRDQFGLVVSAEPDENGDPFLVQASTLMERWGREHDAAEFHVLSRAEGLEP